MTKFTRGNPLRKAELFQFLRFDFFQEFVWPDCTSEGALRSLALDNVHKGRESKQQADEQQGEGRQIDHCQGYRLPPPETTKDKLRRQPDNDQYRRYTRERSDRIVEIKEIANTFRCIPY